MATINDIAQKLGVSKSTVSKGLNHATDISEEMRKKILETAVELGYINKRIQNKEKKLCILIENMEYRNPNEFGHDIVYGFKQMAELDDFIVDIIPVDKEYQRGIPYCVFMLQNGYQGAFVLGFSLIDPWMHDFINTKTPTVLYDNFVPNNPNVSSIGCDSQEGFNLSVKHLVGLGHKKIGLISGPLESYITKARYNAYINALEKYGLEFNQDYVALGYYANETVQLHVHKLYEKGVTALLFSQDIRAISAISECNVRGIKIPEDLSLIGFDDLPIAKYTDPPLTTIRQDLLALGKSGYYSLSCLLNNISISSILLRAPLILRGTTGPAKDKS